MTIDQIKMEALGLLAGDQIRINCPSCGDPEKTLSIVNNGNIILYHCFRASCSIKGAIAAKGEVIHSKPKKAFNPHFCNEVMKTLPTHLEEWLQDNYEIYRPHAQGFKYLTASQRLYMPIFGEYGQVIGGVAKQLRKGIKPKAITYQHEKTLMLHYARQMTPLKPSAPIVVCEDILSATKISECGAVGCALLGTNINDNVVRRLKSHNKEVVLMLDPDATQKSIKYAREYQAVLPFRVSIPPADPKDTSTVQLKELIFNGE